MARKVLLIDEKSIKAKSVLEENIDSKILARVILDVQNIQLKSILGKKLFDDVIEAVYQVSTDDSYTMSSQLKELLDDYITPFLVYAVLVDFLTTNNFKITNKGVLKLNDSNATNLSNDDLNYTANYHRNKMTSYKDALLEYLKEKELLVMGTDIQIASSSIGWYLEGSNISYKNLYHKRNY